MRVRTLYRQCTVYIMIIYRKMERYVCFHTKTLESKANQLEIVLDCIENHSDQPFTSSNNLAAAEVAWALAWFARMQPLQARHRLGM